MNKVLIKKIWDFYSDTLGKTPLHPQYLIKKHYAVTIEYTKRYARGVLLDVGCGRMPYRKEIEPLVTKYIGLDHPEASRLYQNARVKPDIYADANSIPSKNNTYDTVVLFEVLEHVPYAMDVLPELYRVLKPGGYLIGSIPFMYPIHDRGFDFARYTEDALKLMLKKSGFSIKAVIPHGTFFDFWFVSLIVYALQAAKDLPLPITLVILILLIPVVITANILSFLQSTLFPTSHTGLPNNFPLNYTFVGYKKKK